MVIKRNGKKVEFDKQRIATAISKASKSAFGVEVLYQSREIAEEIEQDYLNLRRDMTIREIEISVYDKLVERGNKETARAYEAYRAVRNYKRGENSSDEAIDSLLNLSDGDQAQENSNKNPELNSTQRDLIAGEISKDLAKRKIMPVSLVQAHEDGVIHIHDMDYLIQPMFNCSLVDLGDMLDNGTIINGKMVESPKSFQVACTVTTQIIAQIASNQYGLNNICRIKTA